MIVNKTKLEIVKILHENQGIYISGQEISNRIGVSRTTISNHIQDLREKGYEIKSKTNQGYNMIRTPELIVPEEILWNLNTDYIGQNINFVRELSSTNKKAKALAEEGSPSGTVVINEKQNKGKGRGCLRK